MSTKTRERDLADRDPLGARMKEYEAGTRVLLPRRSLSVIRIDGRSFHTWTKGLQRPYDPRMVEAMAAATAALCEEVSGCILGYTQSDEISLLFHDYASESTEPYFGGVVQKLVSVTASFATAHFNSFFADRRSPAVFDARAFSLPSSVEAVNYLLWRQRDAQRNAIGMLAADRFSAKRLHGIGASERRRMLEQDGVDLAACDPRFLKGTACHRITRTEPVRYFDKRHNEWRQSPPVERSVWVSEPAPAFSADPEGWLAARIPQAPGAEHPAS